MTRPLVWDEAARIEMREAVAYHRDISTQIGSRFLDDVERALTHISVFPESSPRVDGEVRRKNLSFFRFGIFYENLTDRVLILAIGHFARRPGYWADRCTE